MSARRIGLLVNPIAGMGGSVGLKGTDGKAEEAVARGAVPRAGPRAVAFLRALPANVTIVTAGGPMGDDACAEADVSALVVHAPHEPTSANDTAEAARAILDAGVDAFVFVGGDGTARDVAAALEGAATPTLGVPAGAKMYSAVFADTPEAAASVITTFDKTQEREVLDIDEVAFRAGELRVDLHGVLHVPVHERVQGGKLAGDDDDVELETLGPAVVEALAPGHTYVLGAGTTMMNVKRALGFEGTLLGLDVVEIPATGTPHVLALDVNEKSIRALGRKVRVVLSPIGAQGFFLGRGNLPITPAILRELAVPDDIIVVATPSKLLATPALKVDTGDASINDLFPKFLPVITGYDQIKLMRVIS